MRTLTTSLVALTLWATALAAPLAGQQPQAASRPASATATPAHAKVTEEKRGLFAKAKVTPEAAMATALTRVPGGHVTKGELEEEDGKLLYSFDIKVAGRRGIEEIHVDALTGAIIKTEHEADDAAPSAATPSRTPGKAPTKTPTTAPAPTAPKRP